MVTHPDLHSVERLTPEGAARREAMLGDLMAALKRTHRIRRGLRLGTAATCIALAAMTIRFGLPFAMKDPRIDSPGTPRRTVIVQTVERRIDLKQFVVQTDPGVLRRFRPAEPAVRVTRIDDDALLERLTSLDRPSGLIYMGERVVLSTPVTDAELGLDRVPHLPKP